MKTLVPVIVLLFFASSCAVSKYHPQKKFAAETLKEDYRLFRNMLEEAHPSLYWYTPKDSMDYYFNTAEALLIDSMPEQKFRNVLSYVVSKIRCGHTSIRPSRAAQRYFDSQAPSFPLFIKTWPDTTIVTGNLNRRDSNITRGVLLQSIDHRPIQQIIDSFFSHLSTDGYNATHKYQALSNGSSFRAMYAAIYGLKPVLPVSYIDTAGMEKTSPLRLYYPPRPDTTKPPVQPPKIPKKERKRMRLQSMRSLTIDSMNRYAVLEVNTFAKNYKLRKFFRTSFRELEINGIEHLIVDMRGNGGGSVVLSNLLTKYIAEKPFKIADSLYAVRRSSEYGRYRNNQLWNWLFLVLFTRKKQDGNYHFSLFEDKYFKPKQRYHFSGNSYILTGGNTFSAATLFTRALVEQENVVVIGEETGGGGYGNTAWLIPDVTLPNTGVRFRLPLFRLVIDKDAIKGRGVMPEVESLPTAEAIRKGVDYKMEKAKALILQTKD